jgi:16S rRNA (cytosine967-C5)-methyltransferase
MTDVFKQGFLKFKMPTVSCCFLMLTRNACSDTCAGAGGKTLHMAALMENKGLLIAMDLYESKLKQLKIRAKRDGHLISNTALSTQQK